MIYCQIFPGLKFCLIPINILIKPANELLSLRFSNTNARAKGSTHFLGECKLSNLCLLEVGFGHFIFVVILGIVAIRLLSLLGLLLPSLLVSKPRVMVMGKWHAHATHLPILGGMLAAPFHLDTAEGMVHELANLLDLPGRGLSLLRLRTKLWGLDVVSIPTTI